MVIYSRVFFDDDDVQVMFAEKACNEQLGLPEEVLDGATRDGMEMAEKMLSRSRISNYGVYEK